MLYNFFKKHIELCDTNAIVRGGGMKLNSSNTIQWQKQIYCSAYMTPMDVPEKCSGPPWCGCRSIE